MRLVIPDWITKKKNQLAILIVTWVTVQFLLYLNTGIQPILESLKYIGAAEHFLNTGTLPEKRYFFYLTTTLTIAFCIKTGIGFTGVVLIQLFFNLLSTLIFYNSLSKLQNNNISSFLTILLLILCIPYQYWNFYLYTESLFYSFTLILFSCCLQKGTVRFTTFLLQFFLLALAIISRPLGVLLLPCWTMYLIGKANKKLQPILIAAAIATIVILIIISNLILGNISDWQILKPAEYHYIICDITTAYTPLPNEIKNKAPLIQLFQYIKNYPSDFVYLALKRSQAFFFLARTYYSQLHNLALYLLCIILYFPIIINSYLKVLKGKLTFEINTFFSAAILILFPLAIILQCDDYHNRFHNTIIPVFLFSGIFKYFNQQNGFKKIQ